AVPGPAWTRAATGRKARRGALGGPRMHAAISGPTASREPDEPPSLARLRRLVEALPADTPRVAFDRRPARPPEDLAQVFKPHGEYDVRDVLACILDDAPFDENKAEYGQTMVCGYGRPGGGAGGGAANHKKRSRAPRPGPPGGEGSGVRGPIQYGGVIYTDSADKAARFVMDCNQSRVPILFFHDVNGFMVGRDSEQAGIIRTGAKLVN